MTPTDPPTVTRSVGLQLRAEIVRSGKSARGVAADLKKSHVWLARRLRGETPLTVEDVVLIAGAIGVDPVPLIDKALV